MSGPVFVAALAPLARDARVLRHCRALAGAGYRVHAVGIGDLPPAVAAAAGIAASTALPMPRWDARTRTALALSLVAVRTRVSDAAIARAVALIPGVNALRGALLKAIADAPDPGLVVANDWTAVPVALEAKRAYGTPFHYDSHELAVKEHDHRLAWRLLFPPLVEAVERRGLAAAQSVSTVSHGIARAMQQRYQLPAAPDVLMSIPDAAPMMPSAPGARINVLFHGLFLPGRGIETLAADVMDWPAHVHLTLRGEANTPAFAAKIRAVTASGVAAGQITVTPLVAQADVITAANSADVGVFLPDLNMRQHRFAMPNKLFEYLFAGLVPIVPEDTDMAELLRRLNVGVILQSGTRLSRWLKDVTPEQLATEKQRAHRAAVELAAEARNPTMASLVHARAQR